VQDLTSKKVYLSVLRNSREKSTQVTFISLIIHFLQVQFSKNILLRLKLHCKCTFNSLQHALLFHREREHKHTSQASFYDEIFVIKNLDKNLCKHFWCSNFVEYVLHLHMYFLRPL